MTTRRPSNSSAPRQSIDFSLDRSPLQKVETIVGGMSKEMSKEERRQRIMDAEDRIIAKRGKAPVDYQEPRARPARQDEPSYFPPQNQGQSRGARTAANLTNYAPAPVSMRSDEKAPSDAENARREAAVARQARAEMYNSAPPVQASAPAPAPTRAPAQNFAPDPTDGRRRSAGNSPRVLTKAPPPNVRAASDNYTQPPTRQKSVREGRVFDTDPGYAEQNYDGASQSRQTSRDFSTRDGGVYAQPLASPTSSKASPKMLRRFTSIFRRKRESQLPLNADIESRSPSPDAEHHRLGRLRGYADSDARRYEQPKYRDYRNDIRVARVAVEGPAPPVTASPVTTTTPAKDAAWWEKNQASASASRRRASGSQEPQTRALPVDGGSDKQTAGQQTYFQPTLYLKSGPFLRLTGIQKPSTQSGSRRTKELWTGSVMIVTVDSKSSYQQAPNLRIFKQPVELLPPPPPEINEQSGQQLSPEYVDPIAGQVKMSRVGKTLYVKPVEALDEHRDLSRVEDDSGLFEEFKSSPYQLPSARGTTGGLRPIGQDGELRGKFQDIPAYVLHKERGVTFWKWNLEIELSDRETRFAYRINRGPPIGFWIPAKGEMMNIMFHSCNGFSLSVDSNTFSGPDPLWRDVLNSHQTRPFHVMLGGGDQIYNDAATTQTKLFREWAMSKNAIWKHKTPFSLEMQNELEIFYLNRYAMWFSQGLFGMANSQIPMVNIWDDHDIMDGFGSYSDHTMSSPVMSGAGNVAFKYYMLFQHQSLPLEDEQSEPSWLLGSERGPFINELSRSVFMWLGRHTAFLGLDCRTERSKDEILSQETWDLVFNRLKKEIVQDETQHLIILLGIPIAYPRLNFLENILTSRLMDPVKALGRTGALGGFVNKFDGGVEILDDLDDHWTAKHHKGERNWFVQELQTLAAEKSVRITLLGGDVHLAAVGQFYSNRALCLPKDQDHRYMPNIISSAIVNTPPADMVADAVNKRNKVHHLDEDTDEDMIAMFPTDVNNKPRNNHHLLPRRNWCSIKEYKPEMTPPPSPSPPATPTDYDPKPKMTRSLSLGRDSAFRPSNMMRRLSSRGKRNSTVNPPISYPQQMNDSNYFERRRSSEQPMRASADITRAGPAAPASDGDLSRAPSSRPNPFMRRPTVMLPHNPTHMINLRRALDVRINCENEQGDPAGTTTEYRLLVPALDYRGDGDPNPLKLAKPKNRLSRMIGSIRRKPASRSEESFSPPPGQHSRVQDSYDSLQPDPVPVARRRRDSMSPPDPPRLLSNGLPVRTSTQSRPEPPRLVNNGLPVRTRTQPRPAANMAAPLPGPPPGPAPSMRTQQPMPQQLPGPPPGPPPRQQNPASLPGPPPGPSPNQSRGAQRYATDPRYESGTEQRVASDPRSDARYQRAPPAQASSSEKRRSSAEVGRGAHAGYV